MKKKKKQRLLIPFSSLKEGKHEFDFTIGAEFFEQYEQSLVEVADVSIEVDFEKKKNLLELDITFEGKVESSCDRCMDPLSIAIEGEEFLIVKFGDKESDDEHIMYIPESAFELDFSDQVYELINLSMPAKREHEDEANCNQEMLKKLREYSAARESEDEEEIDPRWAALNKLKD
jgi:uncharacterized metal-binding protein YceD (DUF177 family)